MEVMDNYEAAGFGLAYQSIKNNLVFTLFSNTINGYQAIENTSSINANQILTITESFDGNTMKIYVNSLYDNKSIDEKTFN